MMLTASFSTPLGVISITGDRNGIASISIRDNGTVSDETPFALQSATTELNEYFAGKRTNFTFPINPHGTNFQKRVWNELRTIPFGTTLSYLELSKQLGDVKAIRAVASANAKNPLWIVVPCHRVIGTNGTLTGYAGGLWRKKWLRT